MSNFVTKDSRKRMKFKNGFVRDTQDDKPRYDLIYIPLLKRWAELMARGCKKYGERNWEKAEGEEALNRFKASAWRHFIQYMSEIDDGEDHCSAIMFNLGGIELLKEKRKNDKHRTTNI